MRSSMSDSAMSSSGLRQPRLLWPASLPLAFSSSHTLLPFSDRDTVLARASSSDTATSRRPLDLMRSTSPQAAWWVTSRWSLRSLIWQLGLPSKNTSASAWIEVRSRAFRSLSLPWIMRLATLWNFLTVRR